MAVLKSNPYIYIICIMQFIYSLITNMGIASALSIFVLPMLFFVPTLLKKFHMSKIIMFGCACSTVSGVITFLAGDNMTPIIIASLINGLGVLPIAYLTDLMLVDCGSYNQWKGNSRMDGTLGAVKGFANKLGTAIGSGFMGLLLGLSGYNGALQVQSELTILMIRLLIGIIPAILFVIVSISMAFYKLDKLMPQINAENEAKRLAITTDN